jgi:hypothetical protein
MKKVDLETCLINLRRCDDSSIEVIQKLAAAGSILDDAAGPQIVDRVGALIAETVADMEFSANEAPSLWAPLERLVAAVGDCTQGLALCIR